MFLGYHKNMKMPHPHKTENGNALFLILITIFLLGMLSKVMVERNTDTAAIASNAEVKARAANIINQAMNMQSAAQKIVAEGIAPTDINDVAPSDAAAFEAGDHRSKLYHPYGGGIQYAENYQGWTTLRLHKDVTVVNVGPSSDSDIMMIGMVDQSLCAALNTALFDDPSITVVQTAVFNALKDGTSTATLDDATSCSAGTCNERAYQCVTNTGSSEFLYYHLLVPR